MAKISQNPTDFKELGREPCPVCERRGRCKHSTKLGDDLVLCFRLADESVNGYRLVKHTRGCSTYARIGSDAERIGKKTSVPAPKTPPRPDLNELAAKYAASLTDADAERFARELGVSVASLRRLGAGMRGGRLCFPERDASGQVTGISTRNPNRKPKYLVGKGHQRGALTPTGLPNQLPSLLLPEGPTDTAACLDMNLNAVGRPNNSSKADLIAEVARKVSIPIVLGENDEKPDGARPGRDGAIRVATELARILRRPVLWASVPAGFKDVRDFLKSNPARDPHELGRELVANIFATATAVEPSGGFDGAAPQECAENWPDPQPLPSELPPVAPFDLSLVPEALRGWIADIAERAQCPPDYPAVGAMVALASLVGRKVAIRPKRRDDWTVVPNLWGGVIGRPGLLKTPMLQEATRPLKRLEIVAKERFLAELNRNEAKELVRKAERKELEKAIKDAVRERQDAEGLALSGLANRDDSAPTRRRYILNDTTVEKLGEILDQNPNGILMFRDELVGFLRALGKDGHECDRAFYLEAWDGKGRFTYDRIGRGTIDIESAIVSILGGIQPSVLHTFLRTSLDQVGNDGLIQRFQLLVWPDVSKDWMNVDEWPDTESKNRAYGVFTTLSELTAEAVGAESADDGDVAFLRFDHEAQVEFDDWRAELERRLRSDELHPTIEEHLSKYRSLIPSLALLSHLIDGGAGPVRVESLRRAIRWGEYLESHAQRVYHVAANPDIAAAAALARKIVKGELTDGFTLREVHRHEWSGLTDRDVLQGGADLLCELDWLRWTKEETGGAPKVLYSINPKIVVAPRKAPVKTDKSPENDLSSVLTGASEEDSQEIVEPATDDDDSDRRETEARMDVEREAEKTARED